MLSLIIWVSRTLPNNTFVLVHRLWIVAIYHFRISRFVRFIAAYYGLHAGRPGLNFINVLRTTLMLADPESVTRCWWLNYIFTLLGSTCAKASCKTLMKLTPGGVAKRIRIDVVLETGDVKGHQAAIGCKVVVGFTRVDFTNMFTHSFYSGRSQKQKRQSSHQCLFLLLGSSQLNAARKMLVKLTPGVSYIFADCRRIVWDKVVDQVGGGFIRRWRRAVDPYKDTKKCFERFVFWSPPQCMYVRNSDKINLVNILVMVIQGPSQL